MYYGYIYKITNNVNGKIYIGLHASPTFDDTYWGGSGSDFKIARKEVGLHNLSREVLEWCINAEELDAREQYWIAFFDARNPEIGYNIQPGGRGKHLISTSEIVKKKLSEKQQNRESYGFWINNGICECYCKDEALIPEGYVRGRLARTMEKSASKHRGKKVKDKSHLYSAKGTHWYTNGIIDVMKVECPEGFWKGRTNHRDMSGSNNPMYGKPNPRKGVTASEETRKKLSNSIKAMYARKRKLKEQEDIESKGD